MSALCESVAPQDRWRGAVTSFWDVFWAWLDHIAAVIAIVGLPYLVVSNRRRVPRFSFDFSAGGTQTFQRGEITYCRYSFSGSVANKSLDSNSLQRTWLVVWKDRKRKETLSLNTGATISESGETITEPIPFRPHESRKFDIIFEVQLTGNPFATVLTPTMEPVPAGGGLYRTRPKYRYELAFEDVTGSLYDQQGILRSFKGIMLRMGKTDQTPSRRNNNSMPYTRLLLRIALTDALFFVRRNARRLGI